MAAIQRGNATRRARPGEIAPNVTTLVVQGTSIPARVPSSDAVYTGMVAVPRDVAPVSSPSLAPPPPPVGSPVTSVAGLPSVSNGGWTGGGSLGEWGDIYNPSDPTRVGQQTPKTTTPAATAAAGPNWILVFIGIGALIMFTKGGR